ncbi:hypothetical protein [Mastigocladopsis repens]|uniref:hypothetical protein n=1 Tax=Mastigocladopsis repens TaxID=221287 RepID=UPI0002F51201|nr:hypothetical protein [Mastigocladopsis repens]
MVINNPYRANGKYSQIEKLFHSVGDRHSFILFILKGRLGKSGLQSAALQRHREAVE